MAYCTLAQMVDRFGEAMLIAATDRGMLASGEIDQAAVARAIADAGALIDGYLAARYRLPLQSVPALVESLALAIAAYKLHPDVSSEKIRRDYEDALKQLLLVSRGEIRLDVAGVEPEGTGANEVITNQPERPLSAATMKGYI